MLNERVERLDSGVIVCNTESEVINLFKNKPMIYRGLYDMKKGLYCLADAAGIMHSDMLLEMYRQGFYPEFKTKTDADAYYCQEIDLYQNGTDITILTFMFSPYKENKALLGSDLFYLCYKYDIGNLFTRKFDKSKLPLIEKLGSYELEVYKSKLGENAMDIAEELRKYVIEPETDEKKTIKKKMEQDFQENEYAEGEQYEILMDGEPLGYPVTATIDEIINKIAEFKVEYPDHTFEFKEYRHVSEKLQECAAQGTFSVQTGTAPMPLATKKKKKKNIDKQLSLEGYNESLQSEYKQAFDLLVEGTNQICLEDSDTVKEIMKKFDKLKTIKSDKLKLKKAKDLLLDISGYMIDEKFDNYQKKIEKFMNNNKNESVNESEETKFVEDPKELTPKYTVGDYVSFYDTYDQTNKIGKITRINVSEIPDDTTLYYTSYQIEYYVPKGVKFPWGGKSSGQFCYAQMTSENKILSLVSEEEYQKSCSDNISQASDTETDSVAEYVFDVEYEDTQADEWGDGFTSGTLTITKWNDGTYSWYADDIDDGDEGLKSIAQCKKAYKDYLKEGGFRKIRMTQNEAMQEDYEDDIEHSIDFHNLHRELWDDWYYNKVQAVEKEITKELKAAGFNYGCMINSVGGSTYECYVKLNKDDGKQQADTFFKIALPKLKKLNIKNVKKNYNTMDYTTPVAEILFDETLNEQTKQQLLASKNESIKEGFKIGDKVQLKRKDNKKGIVKSIFNGDKDKNDKDIKYLDVEFEDGTKEGRPASDFRKLNESLNEEVKNHVTGSSGKNVDYIDEECYDVAKKICDIIKKVIKEFYNFSSDEEVDITLFDSSSAQGTHLQINFYTPTVIYNAGSIIIHKFFNTNNINNKDIDNKVHIFTGNLTSMTTPEATLSDIEHIVTDYLKKQEKNESLNESESIYSPKLILQAYKKEQEWLKENNYEIGETPDIQLFIIKNNEIVGCTYVPRKDVYTYQPEENEYYLDMVRDSGDVLTDYNLEPAQKLVAKWNESKQWESINKIDKDGKYVRNIPQEYNETNQLVEKLERLTEESLESITDKIVEKLKTMFPQANYVSVNPFKGARTTKDLFYDTPYLSITIGLYKEQEDGSLWKYTPGSISYEIELKNHNDGKFIIVYKSTPTEEQKYKSRQLAKIEYDFDSTNKKKLVNNCLEIIEKVKQYIKF